MSVCIDLPECIKLMPRPESSNKGRLRVDVANSCNYDTTVSLHVKDRMGNMIYNTSIELKAYEEKHIEIPVGREGRGTLSGEWSLKGTSLKLPLKEVAIDL
ncbi:MAG: hypothetical protein N3D82_04695 [Ignisphaera sp.]|nr:hypothetical protein [Ignisphaera sp.]MCX8168308.1 hypothetical protein [Ignisphaera sp.]MDW8085360.1 hypothetical protein [Ignisphaera sp.]